MTSPPDDPPNKAENENKVTKELYDAENGVADITVSDITENSEEISSPRGGHIIFDKTNTPNFTGEYEILVEHEH